MDLLLRRNLALSVIILMRCTLKKIQNNFPHYLAISLRMPIEMTIIGVVITRQDRFTKEWTVYFFLTLDLLK